MRKQDRTYTCADCANFKLREKEPVPNMINPKRNEKTTVLHRGMDNDECHKVFKNGTGISINDDLGLPVPIYGDLDRFFREKRLESYETHLRKNPYFMGIIKKLQGKVLCCDCNADYFPDYCHATVIAKIADEATN